MDYKLEGIVYETANHWVLRTDIGFDVYIKGLCHSTRCLCIGSKGLKWKKRAIDECLKRETTIKRDRGWCNVKGVLIKRKCRPKKRRTNLNI